MMQHMLDSTTAKAFFANCGIEVTDDSTHNVIHLKNKETGEVLSIWAESYFSVAAGIPGLYVEAEEE